MSSGDVRWIAGAMDVQSTCRKGVKDENSKIQPYRILRKRGRALCRPLDAPLRSPPPRCGAAALVRPIHDVKNRTADASALGRRIHRTRSLGGRTDRTNIEHPIWDVKARHWLLADCPNCPGAAQREADRVGAAAPAALTAHFNHDAARWGPVYPRSVTARTASGGAPVIWRCVGRRPRFQGSAGVEPHCSRSPLPGLERPETGDRP
jgi:hypothetical protein